MEKPPGRNAPGVFHRYEYPWGYDLRGVLTTVRQYKIGWLREQIAELERQESMERAMMALGHYPMGDGTYRGPLMGGIC